MEIKADINIHVHEARAEDDHIINLLENIMSALTDLQANVAAEDTEISSVITLLAGINAALDAAGVDQAALAALSADIGAQTAALSAAVVANTPAAPSA